MIKIDRSTWNRKEHFDFFMKLDIPQYIMTFEMDVTPLVSYVKAHHQSFYFSMIHTVMKTANQIENFKYRIIDGEVYLMNVIHPSFTDMIEGSDLFKFVSANYHEDLDAFIEHAKNVSNTQKAFIDLKEEQRHDLVYITTFPWATYTQGTNAMNIDKTDAIPRISWGRFQCRDGQCKMPLTLTLHHGFIDGHHVHLYLEKLKENILSFAKM
jgi:chloramphenicol O-acetyltransferase type A